MMEKNIIKREASISTRLLYARLVKSEIGEKITYGELTDIVGEPVSGGSFFLRTARRMVQREHGIEYDVIWGKGIIRLDSSGMVTRAGRARTEIRRKAKRAVTVLSNVVFEELPPDQKVTFNASMTLYELFRRSAREREFIKLENRVKETGEMIPASKLLAHFTEDKKKDHD